MIELQNVSKSFGRIQAIDDVSCLIPDGNVTVLIGPSGCGKSTTIRLINRLIPPDSGTIVVEGTNINDYRPEELRRQIGYVIQSVGLFPHMTVRENIGVVPRLLRWEKERIRERVEELVRLVGLDPEIYIEKYPHELSGGEAQRIGVARALAADPPVMLMDEPFGAVDPLNREVLQNEFIRVQRELHKTVVFVTHDLNEAILLADRIVLMRSGKIVQEDTPENILEHPSNTFVRDFVGTDRALKRLSRLRVENYMADARTVTLVDGKPKAHERKKVVQARDGYAWVVNTSGRLVGWTKVSEVHEDVSIADIMTPVEASDLAVGVDTSLRQALAHLLTEDVGRLPVVDGDGRVIGEIGIAEIVSASGSGDAEESSSE